MVSFFVDISVKAVVDRDDKHVAVNSKADRNASVAGQGVVCCGIGIFQKIAEQRGNSESERPVDGSGVAEMSIRISFS